MIPVSSRAFMAMQNLTIAELKKCDEKELRPLLPCLVRMATLKQLDNTKATIDARAQILSLLVGIVEVNNIVSLLQIDFHEIETDIRKEQQLRYDFYFVLKVKREFYIRENLIISDRRLVTPIKTRHSFMVSKMALLLVMSVRKLHKKFASFCRSCFTFSRKYSNKIN